jgi:hypothetical protein
MANQTIGFLDVQIWAYLEEFAINRYGATTVTYPPSLGSIPFSSMMAVPELLHPNTVSDFSLCHVAKMATPEFFTNSVWTGYKCSIGASPVPGEAFYK